MGCYDFSINNPDLEKNGGKSVQPVRCASFRVEYEAVQRAVLFHEFLCISKQIKTF